MSTHNREMPQAIGQELETDSRRIELYSAVMTLIANMEGVVLDKKQKMAAATIGGAMCPYDSVFDSYDIRTARANGQEILDVLSGDSVGEHLDPITHRALELAQDNLNQGAMEALRDLTLAQIDSVKQREGNIELSELKDITKRKGANTALIFALEVSPDMSIKKRECYEELGFLFQLVDDFHDVHNDKDEGIITLATLSEGTTELAQHIQTQYKKVRGMFTQNYEAYQLVDFFIYLDKLVAGIGFLRN